LAPCGRQRDAAATPPYPARCLLRALVRLYGVEYTFVGITYVVSSPAIAA